VNETLKTTRTFGEKVWNLKPTKTFKKLIIAEDFSYLATCPKKNVGVYIEDKYGKSVSSGYNGAPAGFDHCSLVSCKEINDHCTNAVHAEINGILNGDTSRMRDGTMYLYGAFPCYRCAQAIVTVKIKTLYHGTLSDKMNEDQKRGLEILLQGKVKIRTT